ncbi:hypothetical protein VUR80DRAFT_6123 [Thermomyces stellatus]
MACLSGRVPVPSSSRQPRRIDTPFSGARWSGSRSTTGRWRPSLSRTLVSNARKSITAPHQLLFKGGGPSTNASPESPTLELSHSAAEVCLGGGTGGKGGTASRTAIPIPPLPPGVCPTSPSFNDQASHTPCDPILGNAWGHTSLRKLESQWSVAKKRSRPHTKPSAPSVPRQRAHSLSPLRC